VETRKLRVKIIDMREAMDKLFDHLHVTPRDLYNLAVEKYEWGVAFLKVDRYTQEIQVQMTGDMEDYREVIESIGRDYIELGDIRKAIEYHSEELKEFSSVKVYNISCVDEEFLLLFS